MAVDLSALKPSKQPRPPRVLVYGGEGIGKSTFFAGAPNPLFIQTEDGLGALEVAHYPQEGPAKSYNQVMDVIKELYTQEHDFKTVVVDSADWLESLVNAHVSEEHGKDSIEDFGYGKGYVHAADAFRKILEGLNALRVHKGMIIGLTAHAQVKRFDDPSSESYDRYQLKMHERSSSILREWCDIIGFASQRTIVHSEDVGFKKQVKRGVSTGERLLHLEERPAFLAKRRGTLPESIPLDWDEFYRHLMADYATKGDSNG